MSNRQKFWIAVPLFLAVVATCGWFIGLSVGGAEGVYLSVLFGFAAGTIGGAVMPLEWHP